MKSKLSDICNYVTEKIEVSKLDLNTYISTENMLPDKAGVTVASGLPTVLQVPRYQKGDVLISNIRPYFKKIWYANDEGGCSNDVLIFRAKEGVSSEFLYYVLADDGFFEYTMTTSKGTKMPRGDKKAIMNYGVPDFEIKIQEKIAGVLRGLDRKIEINNHINDNLEEQLRAIFINTFGNHIANATNDNVLALGELVSLVDNRGKTPPLAETKTEYPIIDVRALSGKSRIVNFDNCLKYVNETTYSTWFRSGHPQQYDILLSTVGSLAEIKIFIGNRGCIAQNVVGLRSKGISAVYLYEYLSYIKNDLVAYNIGSVQPSIKVTHIMKHLIYIPNDNELDDFDNLATAVTKQIFLNSKENENLIQLRNSILPKLMSGEIDVADKAIQAAKLSFTIEK